MLPAEVPLAAAGRPELPGGGGAAPMMPPFFMAPIWPAAAADAEPTAHAAAAHDRALAASRNHREAEKRRRERIKCHLDRLRAVLACDPKIDKASLLAKAVERVRDLKQRMAGIGEASSPAAARLFPTEHDEIVVLPSAAAAAAAGAAVFEASVCCDDRSDLLPELIETLRALRLRALRAEMATLGGRVRNVLVLARDSDGHGEHGGDGESVAADVPSGGGDFLREALRALVDRPATAAADRPKRRRVVDMDLQAA